MKTISTLRQSCRTFMAVIVAAVAISMTSCSGSSTELLNSIPEDADFVAVINAKTLCESAGIEIADGRISMPSCMPADFTDESEYEKLKLMVKNGVNPDMIAFVGYYDPYHLIIVGKIDDMEKFDDFLDDEEYDDDEEDGMTIYKRKNNYNDTHYVVVKGDIFYTTEHNWYNEVNSEYIKRMKKFVEDAQEKSFATSPYASYINKGNAGCYVVKMPEKARRELNREKDVRRALNKVNMLDDVEKMLDGAVCGYFNISGDKATATAKILDEEGNEISFEGLKEYFDPSAKIDPSALKYIHEDVMMVGAGALKGINWDEYIDLITSGLSRSERAGVKMVKSYLEQIDGTIAYGIGFTGGIESIFKLSEGNNINMFEDIVFSAVVETKDGKAKSLIDEAKGVIDTYGEMANELGVAIDNTGNGFVITLREPAIEIYIEAHDNYIVCSNKKIETYSNKVVDNNNLGDYSGAIAAAFSKESQLAKDLDIKFDISACAGIDLNSLEMTATADIQGDSKYGVVGKFLELISFAIEKQSDIDDLYDRYRENTYNSYNQYGNYDYSTEAATDYAYADTCAVDTVVASAW